MTTRSGVDIIVKARDEATPTIDRIGAGMTRLEATAEGVGAKVRDRLGEGVIGGVTAVLAGGALDAAFEQAVAAVRADESGFELGVRLADAVGQGLRSVPIAGPLGELGAIWAEPMAENFVDLFVSRLRSLPLPESWDAVLAGTQTTGDQTRTQEAAQREGATRIKIAEDISRLERQLGDDLLSDLERRRQALEQAAGGILRDLQGLDAETARTERDRVRRLIEERLAREEERRLAEEAAKQRIEDERRQEQERRERQRELEAEQRRQEQEQRERQRREEVAANERERLARSIREAENRTPGALESRSLSGRATAFVQSRTVGVEKQTALLAGSNQLLRRIESALNRMADKQTAVVDFP